MKQLLIIATLLISLTSNACDDHGKAKKKGKCNIPPVGMRCTEDDSNGEQCRGWSRQGEEYLNQTI